MNRCAQQCLGLRLPAHGAQERSDQFLGVLAQLGKAVLDAREAATLHHLHQRELGVVVVREVARDVFVKVTITNQRCRRNAKPFVKAPHHRYGELTSAGQDVRHPRHRTDVGHQVFFAQALLVQAEVDGFDGVDG